MNMAVDVHAPSRPALVVGVLVAMLALIYYFIPAANTHIARHHGENIKSGPKGLSTKSWSGEYARGVRANDDSSAEPQECESLLAAQAFNKCSTFFVRNTPPATSAPTRITRPPLSAAGISSAADRTPVITRHLPEHPAA
jgi:hypothetical protein